MKTINYSIWALLPVLLCAYLTSCGEDYSSPLKGQSVDDVIFETTSYGSNSKTITIGKDDLSKCTITSSAAWCSATIQVAAVVINVQPNKTFGERQATITLTDPEDATTLSFKVTQKQNDAILVDGETFTIPEEGGMVSIKVQSNVSYNVEFPATATWLTKSTSSTRGLTSSTIVLRADKNNSGDEREAIVKLTDSTSGTSSQFTVKQELTPVVTIDYEQLDFDDFGGEVEITVNSNIELKTDFDDYWLTDGGKTNKGDFGFIQNIIVSPLPNNLKCRSTNVTFTDKINKWNIAKSITINQQKKLYIQNSSNTMSIYVGQTKKLTLINLSGQSVVWTSSDNSIATVDSEGLVKGVGHGNATIKVISSDGKYSDEINVEVTNLSNYMNCTAYFTTITHVYPVYAVETYLAFKIENRSNFDVKLTKYTVYRDNEIFKTGELSYKLSAALYGYYYSYDLKYAISNLDGNNHSYKCQWEFEYDGFTFNVSSNTKNY